MTLHRFKMELTYDGTAYSGWQRQQGQNVRTIQGELETAIEKIVNEPVSVLGSGRTDAGVHALYQVAAFNSATHLAPETLVRAINASLPADIRVFNITEVAPTFHPIHDVLRKRYRYLLTDARPGIPFFKNNIWHLHHKLDTEAMQNAAKFLLGTHDFRSFETQGSPRNSTVRTISHISVERCPFPECWTFPRQRLWENRNHPEKSPDAVPKSGVFPLPSLIVIEVESNGFLYNMVRSVTGTLFLFGTHHKGYTRPERMKEIVDAADRSLAGPTAPPWGLYMIDVVYNDASLQ